ncbi:nuclease-related domain-containing protein [Frankia sp. AgKG'84/4]|uniref:nuclease-related domain-containing protein n=1 Tax=Frankia sp. AgKG'84/4 TaxID=573490 RepID=UPI002029BAAC|nr:nuclease-related domain-containing protein [Frankia sp. AgKG'84/4]MCL9793267.1 NERD domain-containing protein [Frankia sp. AgKG'84/4]
MATITRPTMTRVGRPGHSLQTEYQRARENQALVRRDRLARQVPRIAVRAAVVGLVLALVIAFGLGQPAVAIAVFFLVFLAWPAGIVAASFGTAPDIEFLREGAEAERKTAKAIARLRRHGYLILHDRAVPYSEATIGHLLVGPGGVMVLGSDNSKGTVRYTKGGAVCDGESLKPVIDRASWLGGEVRNQIRAALPMLKIPVIPVLVMVEANVLWSDGALDGVTIISMKDVANFIRKKPGRLNPGEVRQIIAASERLFPAFSANRLADEVTVDRDQWLALMDALRTIRERDGDASELLDRLAQIEADLGRQADVGTRAGMPLAVPATPPTAAATAAPASSEQPPADAGPISSIGPTPAPDSIARPRRGRILAAVRPPRETAEPADSDAAQERPAEPPKGDPPAAGA